ncbi:MAG: DUF2029 domain-containing protein [Phycisphaerales bacterium]|nr:DUF2029 domain-containing protein [Phycisphaerales bacterium]
MAGTQSLLWVWLVGFAMRGVILPTAPFLEDDYYRYLWDGAVVAHGVNPYDFAPAEVFGVYGGTPHAALPVGLLGADADAIRLTINHPQLTTVYGPVAQAAFAAAHGLSPWSMLAWRCVLIVFDVLTMIAVLALLRRLGKPAAWAAWYWWNPILLREVISSGHMDVIALPLVVGALLMAARGTGFLVGVTMALAVGVKIWPLVLVPMFVRAAGARVRAALVAIIAFLAVSVLLWAPALLGARAESNGFQAYALQWYNNDAVFAGTAWTIQTLLPHVGLDAVHGPRITRFIVGAALLVTAALQMRRWNGSLDEHTRRSLVVLAVMFFLIPAQFPWYYLWMLPLLAAMPRASLLAYTALLPLYYVHYELPWVVWIEHLPVLAWFLWEWRMCRSPQSAAAIAVEGQ